MIAGLVQTALLDAMVLMCYEKRHYVVCLYVSYYLISLSTKSIAAADRVILIILELIQMARVAQLLKFT